MRIIAFILSMVILTSSLNASNFVLSLSMLSSQCLDEAISSVDNCCSSKLLKKSIDEESAGTFLEADHSDHAKGLCNGVNCDCKCCGHIVYIPPAFNVTDFLPNSFRMIFKFSFEYQRDFVSGTFIPPNRS